MERSEDYPVFNVTVDELHSATYQPEARMAGGQAFNLLKASIQRYGLKYPPLVTRRKEGDGYTVVDGHRRIAAIKQCGWPRIPVLVTDGESKEIFATVCGTTCKVSANQWIDVFLKGGMVMSGPTRNCIEHLHEVMGREFLQELLIKKMSPQIWNVAGRVLRYAELGDDEKPSVLRWLLRYGCTSATAYITGGNSPDQLRNAYKANKQVLM